MMGISSIYWFLLTSEIQRFDQHRPGLTKVMEDLSKRFYEKKLHQTSKYFFNRRNYWMLAFGVPLFISTFQVVLYILNYLTSFNKKFSSSLLSIFQSIYTYTEKSTGFKQLNRIFKNWSCSAAFPIFGLTIELY